MPMSPFLPTYRAMVPVNQLTVSELPGKLNRGVEAYRYLIKYDVLDDSVNETLTYPMESVNASE